MDANTALLLIATGNRYRRYVSRMVESAKTYFVQHDTILWTDKWVSADVDFLIEKPAAGFPNETLYRYHSFLKQRWLLERYDYLFYVDIDAWFVNRVNPEDIFSDGITATTSPGYVGTQGTPERNPKSTAYVETPRIYFAGGFIGGKTGSFLNMAETIKKNIDIDTENSILAGWHDESHLNRYLYDNPPAKVLYPGYCYPCYPSEMHEEERDRYKGIWKRAGFVDFVPKIALANKRLDDERGVAWTSPLTTPNGSKETVYCVSDTSLDREKNPGPLTPSQFRIWENKQKRKLGLL